MKVVLILCVVVAAVMAAPQGQVVDPGFYSGGGQVVDPGFYQGPSGGHGGQGGRYVNGVHVVDQADNSKVTVVENPPDNGAQVNVVNNNKPYPAHLNGQQVGGSNPNIDIGPVYAIPPGSGGTWNRPIRPRPGVHPGARDGK